MNFKQGFILYLLCYDSFVYPMPLPAEFQPTTVPKNGAKVHYEVHIPFGFRDTNYAGSRRAMPNTAFGFSWVAPRIYKPRKTQPTPKPNVDPVIEPINVTSAKPEIMPADIDEFDFENPNNAATTSADSMLPTSQSPAFVTERSSAFGKTKRSTTTLVVTISFTTIPTSPRVAVVDLSTEATTTIVQSAEPIGPTLVPLTPLVTTPPLEIRDNTTKPSETTHKNITIPSEKISELNEFYHDKYKGFRDFEIRMRNETEVRQYCAAVAAFVLQRINLHPKIFTRELGEQFAADYFLCKKVIDCFDKQSIGCENARPCEYAALVLPPLPGATTDPQLICIKPSGFCLICTLGLLFGAILAAGVAAGAFAFGSFLQMPKLTIDDFFDDEPETTTVSQHTTSATPSSTTTATTTTTTSSTTEPSTTTEREEEDSCPYEPSIDFEETRLAPRTKRTQRNASDDLFIVLLRRSREIELAYPDSPFGDGSCRSVFNEFSTDNPGHDKAEFIEYKRVCAAGGRNKGGSFKGRGVHAGSWSFATFGISAIPPAVHAIIVHEGEFEKVGNEWLFLVGGETVDGVDQRLNGHNVQYSGTTSNDIIPNGSPHPHALILIHARDLRNILQKFTLPGWRWNGYRSESVTPARKAPLPLTSALVAILKEKMQDMVVYGAQLETDRCDVFESIWPPLAGMKHAEYVIRDWEVNDPTAPDFSANRCVTHSKPLSPQAWTIGKPTPGKPNECDFSVPFIISKNLELLSAAVGSEEPMEQGACTSAHASSTAYKSLTAESYRAAVEYQQSQQYDQCPTGVNPELNLPQTMFQLNLMKSFLITYHESNIYPWENVNRLASHIKEFITNYLSDIVDTEFMFSVDIAPWLDVTINQKDPKQTVFSCAFCKAFTENNNRYDRPSSSLISALMTEEGHKLATRDQAKVVNKNHFKAHCGQRVHLDAVSWLMEQLGVKVLQDLNVALLNQVPAQIRHWYSTMNFFEQVVLFVKHNIPIRTIPALMKQQRRYGCPVGFLYTNIKGITNMIYEIGIVSHKLSMNKLLQLNQPFSLILDGTTLKSDKSHYVLVYLQTLAANNQPILLHYRMFPLGSDLSGFGYFSALLSYLQAESFDLLNYFKRNLVAVVADGASNMKSTFIHHISELVGRPVEHIWCLAHKMDLGLKHAEALSVEFDRVITVVNKLHNYFMNAPKRYAKLVERGRKSGLRVRHIPNIIKVRWVSTQYSGINAIFEMYEVILRELEANTKELKGKELETANELYSSLCTSNFVSSLGFLMDATGQMTNTLLSLSKPGTLLISNVNKRNTLLFSTRNLFEKNGPSLSTLLGEAICNGREGCTLHEFETQRVSYKGIQLRHAPHEKLRDIRRPFLQRLVEEINHYFPVSLFERYFIFNPKTLKNSIRGISTAVTWSDVTHQQQMEIGLEQPSNVVAFAKNAIYKFGFESGYFNKETEAPRLWMEWEELVTSIVDDPLFQDVRNSPAEVFWPNALMNANLKWSDLTRKLVKNVLTIGATSIEAERGFSLASWFTSNRHRMDSTLLDHYMRIKYNLPDDVKKWNSIHYIMSWLDNGHCLVDDKSCNTASPDEDDDEDSYSYIQKMDFGKRGVDTQELSKYKKIAI